MKGSGSKSLDDSSKLKERKHALRSQSVQSLVAKKPAFTLSFENLTVHVPGAKRRCLGSGPLRTYAQEYLGMSVEQQEPFYALNNVSGIVKTGEMVLVLGANASSSSTLIRSLTARLSPKDDISGSILFNGLPLGQDAWQGWRRLAPYVSSSDTTHAAVLTVRETLVFAAQCNSNGEQSKEDINDIVDEILEALDLAHVADTVVGDENLRGISGGQKRRVTVGEMLMNQESSFLGLENITDGLSSKDSQNLIELVENTCKVFRYSAIVSLLQPSDEIVDLFDKLLVLSPSGRLEYFGPVDRNLLRDTFLGLDADVSLDAGSICDLVLNQSVTSTPEKQFDIEKRFISSSAGGRSLRFASMPLQTPTTVVSTNFYPKTSMLPVGKNSLSPSQPVASNLLLETLSHIHELLLRQSLVLSLVRSSRSLTLT